MPPRNALALVAALALSALALAALFVRRNEAVPPREDAPSLVRALGELNETQVRMLAVLERLEADLGVRLESTGSPAPAVGPESDALTTLAEGIDALTLELETLRTQPSSRAAQAPNAQVSLLEMRDRRPEPDWERLGELEQSWRADERGTDRAQYFQSIHDVLELYGPPSAIYRPKSGGILLCYRKHPEGTAGPVWFFRYQEGMIVEFFFEDQPGDSE